MKFKLHLALVAATICLLCSISVHAKKPVKPPVDDPINSAWVIVDSKSTDQVTLLTSDGLQSQKVVGGRGKSAREDPAWSYDGNWIAYFRSDLNGDGSSLKVVRPDGSGDTEIFQFARGADNAPRLHYGLQWVPGEVDRVVYSGLGAAQIYTLSTVDAAAPEPLGLFGEGAAMSPDLDSETAGYQGAIAYSNYGGILTIVLVQEGPSGLEVDIESTVELTSFPIGQVMPAWSHDGLEIAFLHGACCDWGKDLMVLPVDATPGSITLLDQQIRLLDHNEQGFYHRPTWSPDDTFVAYIGQVGGEPSGGKAFDLFRVASDGMSLPINVTQGSRRPTYVDWDPLWENDIENP